MSHIIGGGDAIIYPYPKIRPKIGQNGILWSTYTHNIVHIHGICLILVHNDITTSYVRICVSIYSIYWIIFPIMSQNIANYGVISRFDHFGWPNGTNVMSVFGVSWHIWYVCIEEPYLDITKLNIFINLN